MTAYELQPDGTLREVADPPTRADLVQVVRCRDCYYCTDSPAWPGAFECDFINRGVEPDGFCAWGERRDA